MFRLPRGLCVVLFLGLLVGCNSSSPHAPAKVSGQVKYKGEVLKGGSIAFHVEKGPTYSSSIGQDGTYEVIDLPEGNLVVTVETESVNTNAKPPTYGGDKGAKLAAERMAKEGRGGPSKMPEGLYRKIPSKYNNSKTSPLSVTLAAGRQIHEFDLKD